MKYGMKKLPSHWLQVCSAVLAALLLINCMDNKTFDQEIEGLLNHTVPIVTQAQFGKMLHNKKVQIIDARSPEEYKVSHIKKALFVDYEYFSETDASSLNKTDTIVVYCSVGYRSEKIGEQLQALGFTKVYNLYGGIFDWKNNSNEVVNDSGITDSVHTYNKKWSKWLIKGIKVY